MKLNEEISSSEKTPLARGKWSNLLEKGSNIAVLDLDVVDQFPDSASVNRALRVYLRMKQDFATLHVDLEDSLGGRDTPLPFDPRNGKRPESLTAAE